MSERDNKSSKTEKDFADRLLIRLKETQNEIQKEISMNEREKKNYKESYSRSSDPYRLHLKIEGVNSKIERLIFKEECIHNVIMAVESAIKDISE